MLDLQVASRSRAQTADVEFESEASLVADRNLALGSALIRCLIPGPHGVDTPASLTPAHKPRDSCVVVRPPFGLSALPPLPRPGQVSQGEGHQGEVRILSNRLVVVVHASWPQTEYPSHQHGMSHFSHRALWIGPSRRCTSNVDREALLGLCMDSSGMARKRRVSTRDRSLLRRRGGTDPHVHKRL